MFLSSKKVICRICGKETKIEIFQDHSNLCKEIEELKKDSLGVDDKIVGFFNKAEKLKKHTYSKIQLVK